MPIVVVDGGIEIRAAIDWLETPYFSNKRSVTIRNAVQAVGLLYDFWASRDAPSKQGSFAGLQNLLASFGHALFYGTIGADGNCPYDLYWKPRPSQAKTFVAHAERFARYCGGDAAAEALEANRGLGRFVGNAWRDLAASGGILGHLRKVRQLAPASISFSVPIGETFGDERPTPFPADRVLDLITNGCRRERKLSDPNLPPYLREYNVRDQLALCLLFGGGIRSSELFHIFTNDVQAQANGKVRVLLYHPSRGAISWTPPGHSGEIKGNREDYLRSKYELLPRHLYDGRHRLWAGWKNLLLLKGQPHFYTQIFWLRAHFEQLFAALHTLYVRYVLLRLQPHHPYYFVSLDRATLGEPWTLSSFQEAWVRCNARIGLQSSKYDGTNPHAARHWYGQTAADMGIDPRIRQIMMHHRNITSQLKYQRPGPEQVHRAIVQAQRRMLSALGDARSSEGHSLAGALKPSSLEHLLALPDEGDDTDALQWMRFRSDPLDIMNSWRSFHRVARS